MITINIYLVLIYVYNIMINEETYQETGHLSHTYNNIKFTKGPQYLRLLQLLNATMQPNLEETSYLK